MQTWGRWVVPGPHPWTGQGLPATDQPLGFTGASGGMNRRTHTAQMRPGVLATSRPGPKATLPPLPPSSWPSLTHSPSSWDSNGTKLRATLRSEWARAHTSTTGHNKQPGSSSGAGAGCETLSEEYRIQSSSSTRDLISPGS